MHNHNYGFALGDSNSFLSMEKIITVIILF